MSDELASAVGGVLKLNYEWLIGIKYKLISLLKTSVTKKCMDTSFAYFYRNSINKFLYIHLIYE
jgi:hypothetical protein